ncbi:hypothetical protein [Kitasatospora cheerisanensis]|uniref:amino acid kinase family protein n=1 Tax=Kitasatospora cheerisanensis TaxID=81942 RepID=UPI00068B20AD|nr:hypothetical protein [Kitasatospora cheerisanensis]
MKMAHARVTVSEGESAEQTRWTGGRAEAPDLSVIKIGGSLVSQKDRAGHLDLDLVDRYARLMAELWTTAPGKVVLVVGGGAIGHGAVRELDPGDRFAALGLTRATFTVKWAWVEALSRHGVPGFPVQVGGLCVLRDDRPAAQLGAVEELLRTGCLPVLSGDCVMTPEGRLEVFGSDRVPEIFLGAERTFRRIRVAVLTDVPGVLRDGPGGNRTIPFIDADDPEGARTHIWAAAAHDTSGAMAGKVASLQELARSGAECVILRGAPDMAGLDFLVQPMSAWSEGIPRTLIARR